VVKVLQAVYTCTLAGVVRGSTELPVRPDVGCTRYKYVTTEGRT